MTLSERHYLWAIKAELPIAIVGGCVSILGVVSPRWLWLTNVLLLATILWYDIIFKGNYTAVTRNALTWIIFIVTCITQFLWLVHPYLLYSAYLPHGHFYFVLQFPMLLFWTGYIFSFMLRQGMSTWIPALFTFFVQLLLLSLYVASPCGLGLSFDLSIALGLLFIVTIMRSWKKSPTYVVILYPLLYFGGSIIFLALFFYYFFNSPWEFRFG